jgi:hypothetical protein
MNFIKCIMAWSMLGTSVVYAQADLPGMELFGKTYDVLGGKYADNESAKKPSLIFPMPLKQKLHLVIKKAMSFRILLNTMQFPKALKTSILGNPLLISLKV